MARHLELWGPTDREKWLFEERFRDEIVAEAFRRWGEGRLTEEEVRKLFGYFDEFGWRSGWLEEEEALP